VFTPSALFRLKQGYLLTDDPCSIWNILMFSPSLFCEASAVSVRNSYSTTTMTSADFPLLAGSPPVRAFSFCLSPPDLPERVFVFFGLHNGVLAHPLSEASYPIPVRRYRLLQSRFLHCLGYPKPACDLLTLAGVTRCVRDFHPLEKYCTLSLAVKVYLYF